MSATGRVSVYSDSYTGGRLLGRVLVGGNRSTGPRNLVPAGSDEAVFHVSDRNVQPTRRRPSPFPPLMTAPVLLLVAPGGGRGRGNYRTPSLPHG